MKNKILKAVSVVMAILAVATMLGASIVSASNPFESGNAARYILTAIAAGFAAAAVIAGKSGWDVK